jgi:hypothetical protein
MKFEIITIDEQKLQELNISEFVIEDVEIGNDTEYLNLCELLKKVKGKENEIKEFFAEPKAQAYKNHKEISSMEKERLEKLANFETLAKKRIGEYQLKLEEQNTIENPLAPPKVKGISSQDTYKWKIIDESKIPREYLQVNEKLINQIIKQTNGSFEIPGIEIYKEKSVRVKSDD